MIINFSHDSIHFEILVEYIYCDEFWLHPLSHPLQGSFVAAFAQSNEGDVSPNTKGPHCQDTGKKCEFYHSTCNGKVCVCVCSFRK